MTTHTIDFHGLAFDFLDDGELNDLRVTDRDEFMAHHGDSFGEGRFDEGFSEDAMCEWARTHLADDAWKRCDAPALDEYAVRGVRRSDFYYSTGGGRHGY